MFLLEQINNKHNKSHEYTHSIIINYINNNGDLDELEDIFTFIISKLKVGQLNYVLDIMSTNSKTKYIILKNAEYIINLMSNERNYSFELVSHFLDLIKKDITDTTVIKNICNLLIYKHYFHIKNYVCLYNRFILNTTDFDEMKSYFCDIYQKEKKKILKENILNMIYFIPEDYEEKLENINKINENIHANFDEIYQLFFAELIDGILKDENKTIIDLHYLDEGGYSKVFVVGEKILKIGSTRYTHNIPNSKLFLQPFLRLDLKTLHACVEITTKVKTYDIKIDEQKLYEYYKQLRNEGIVWFDPKMDNVGELIMPNNVLYKNKVININQKYNGFDKNIDDILLPGEIVICDLDAFAIADNFDFDDDEVNYRCLNFESKYQRELKKEMH